MGFGQSQAWRGTSNIGEENPTFLPEPLPNKGLQPTASSVRSCVAPASSGG